MQHKLVSLLFVGMLLLAGCAPRSADQLAGPQAWIDSPLDGSSLALAPLELVAHGSDPGGIITIEFSIDGASVGSVSADAASVSLQTARQSWTPPAGGTYTLTVRAQNRGGAWSGPVSVVFRVGAEVSPSPTVPPPATLTSTPTPTTTSTATSSPTPAPVFVRVELTPKAFNHQNANQGTCNPNQISLQVTVGDPKAVSSVLLFYSLSGDSGSTAWNDGAPMAAMGGGLYAASLAADSVPGAAGYAQATLRYQFVAFETANQVLARSLVYSDVTLGTCP